MGYSPRKETSLEDAVTFLNAELHVNVEREFQYLDIEDFVIARREIESGMTRGAVFLNLRDKNDDAVKYQFQASLLPIPASSSMMPVM